MPHGVEPVYVCPIPFLFIIGLLFLVVTFILIYSIWSLIQKKPEEVSVSSEEKPEE